MALYCATTLLSTCDQRRRTVSVLSVCMLAATKSRQDQREVTSKVRN